MATKLMPEGVSGWAGYVLALVLGVFGYLQHQRKAKIDETVSAHAMWEGLAKAHTAQIDSLSKRLEAAEATIAKMRLDFAEQLAGAEKKWAAEAADVKKRHAADLASRDDQIAGLVRLIAQNSQSSAMMIGDVANAHESGMDVARAVGRATARKRKGPDE